MAGIFDAVKESSGDFVKELAEPDYYEVKIKQWELGDDTFNPGEKVLKFRVVTLDDFRSDGHPFMFFIDAKPKWGDKAKLTAFFDALFGRRLTTGERAAINNDPSALNDLPLRVSVLQYKRQDGAIGNKVGGFAKTKKYTPGIKVNPPAESAAPPPDRQFNKTIPAPPTGPGYKADLVDELECPFGDDHPKGALGLALDGSDAGTEDL